MENERGQRKDFKRNNEDRCEKPLANSSTENEDTRVGGNESENRESPKNPDKISLRYDWRKKSKIPRRMSQVSLGRSVARNLAVSRDTAKSRIPQRLKDSPITLGDENLSLRGIEKKNGSERIPRMSELERSRCSEEASPRKSRQDLSIRPKKTRNHPLSLSSETLSEASKKRAMAATTTSVLYTDIYNENVGSVAQNTRPTIEFAKTYNENVANVVQTQHLHLTPTLASTGDNGVPLYDRSKWEPLINLYGNEDSWLFPLPWDKTLSFEADQYYIQMTMDILSRNGEFRTGKVTELGEVFDPSNTGEVRPSRVLIRGDAGYGKSTLCTKLAYDWAREIQTFPCFPCYNTFILKYRLRDLPPNANLETELVSFLHSYSGDERTTRDDTIKTIKAFGKQFLIVLDGFDETNLEYKEQVKDLFRSRRDGKQSCFRSASIILTSRPETNFDLHRLFGKHLRLTGLSQSNRKELISKFFKNDVEKTSVFNRSALSSFRDGSPLLTSLLCYSFTQCLFEYATSYVFVSLAKLLVRRSIIRNDLNYSEARVNDIIFKIGEFFNAHLNVSNLVVPANDWKRQLAHDYECVVMSGLFRINPSGNTKSEETLELVHKMFAEDLAHFFLCEQFLSLSSLAEKVQFFKELDNKYFCIIVDTIGDTSFRISVDVSSRNPALTYLLEIMTEGRTTSSNLDYIPLKEIYFGYSDITNLSQCLFLLKKVWTIIGSEHLVWSLIPDHTERVSFRLRYDTSAFSRSSVQNDVCSPSLQSLTLGPLPHGPRPYTRFVVNVQNDAVSPETITEVLRSIVREECVESLQSVTLEKYFTFLTKVIFANSEDLIRLEILSDKTNIHWHSKSPEFVRKKPFFTWDECKQFFLQIEFKE